MICDRYELRDEVIPGAGRFRGGLGVVKKQRILTDGFITHECDRHEGQCGALQIYNAVRPEDITDMPAKFAGLRVASGDMMAFYTRAAAGTETRSTGRRRRCWRSDLCPVSQVVEPVCEVMTILIPAAPCRRPCRGR